MKRATGHPHRVEIDSAKSGVRPDLVEFLGQRR